MTAPVAASGSAGPPNDAIEQAAERPPRLDRPPTPGDWPRDPASLRRQLKWLIAIRLVVVTSIFLLYFLLALVPKESPALLPPRFVFLLLGLAYGFSLAYLGLLAYDDHAELQAYAQFFGDLLLITTLVYWFGGSSSPFSMLYLIVISIAAALLRRRAGMLVANVAYLLYAGTLVGLHYNWLRPPPIAADQILFGHLLYNLSIHLLGFYGVAFFTSILARNATLAERELAAERESLADLKIVYHDVVQSMSSGLITTDLDGVVTSLNRSGEQQLRLRLSPNAANEPPRLPSLVGRSITDSGLFGVEQWQQLADDCRRGSAVRTEVLVKGSEGRELCFGFTLTPLTDAHGSLGGYIMVFQDLTEWRALRAELRQRDRMAAVGELAAGIAHEIGNPLAAISGSVQLLSPGAEADPQRSKLLSIVLRESQRLDRTIKSFLQFARPKERSSAWFDVARLLAEHAELLSNSQEMSAAHRLVVDLDPPSARLLADPDQVSQIFWNLVRNGLKAMPGGGTLTVAGRLLRDSYQLRVSDTGRGMSDEERTKLFQPFKSFFDQGTGLGMAIVYRIVQEHGGRLLVDSTPEKGTTITCELPIGGPQPLPSVQLSYSETLGVEPTGSLR